MPFNRRSVSNESVNPGDPMMHYPNPIKVVKRRGFTALELIIVLVVGFSIIALSASKMGQLFSASSTAAAMGSILDLFTATRSLRGATGYGKTGTDDLIGPLIKAKMVPKSLAVSSEGEKGKEQDVLRNEWKGLISIKPIDNDGVGFDLEYDLVPGDACSQITQNLLHSGNFMKITVGGDGLTVSSSVAEVVGACAGKGDGKGVKMIFNFRE